MTSAKTLSANKAAFAGVGVGASASGENITTSFLRAFSQSVFGLHFLHGDFSEGATSVL